MLETEICGVKIQNPTILASGIRGIGSGSFTRAAKEGAGAAVSKSCCLQPRAGYASPTVLVHENMVLNAIGLANPGVEEEIKEIKTALETSQIPIIASVFENSIETFGEVARKVSEANPHLIELDMSCPHVKGVSFAYDADLAAKVTANVKENTKIPIIVKLSPNVSNIGNIAKKVEEAGADAISAINSASGMMIDIESGRPILGNKTGGLTGPAIKPIGVRCVYEICKTVNIPVLGIGGIMTGNDAIEYIMAGATAVQIGSGAYYRKNIFKEVCKEIQDFMKSHGYSKLNDMKGLALR
ncbi:dihydroorotate dehydrogenase [Candidatus Micrarchaeota archaeon]|nr:dihydroorotate dehydrogenase [Candidatus Micrarchaeota archaeon]